MFEIKGEDVINGRWSNEKIIEVLKDMDAMVFGCPTHIGSVSAVFTAFIEWRF